MTHQILQALGGLGIFLLAMLVMTEGLRGLAGRSLHNWLTLFTRSPGTGALTGTVVTGLLQSSGATIVATVGFVAAGLITFPQSIGIVLGANVGTTVTGWLVAVFGFKLKIGMIAMPLVLAGVMLKIFSRGRTAEAGKALAGFGLIFIGIDMMQVGMSGFEGSVTPASFPPDTISGRMLLVGIGIVVTLITQSSSAGVAMTMTALSVGALNFPQAAAMVIGMDVGTTITAIIAAIGSSEAARRTGFSHTIYNLFSVAVALLILSPYILLLNRFTPNLIANNPAIALVGFHTLFNVIALVVVLPFTKYYARFMEWLVPERETGLARRLDKRLLTEPQAAHAALDATLQEAFDFMLQSIEQRLKTGTFPIEPTQQQARQELHDTRDFLDDMNRSKPAIGTSTPAKNGSEDVRKQLVSSLHALDHLRRILERLANDECIFTLRNEARFASLVGQLRTLCSQLRGALPTGIDESLYEESMAFAKKLRDDSENMRDLTIAKAVKQEITVAQSGRWLAAYRWLERMSHHLWRVSAQLGGYDGDEAVENNAANGADLS